MERLVRYCTSSDGTRIAYTTYGGLGPVPVVLMSNWVFSQQVGWQVEQFRTLYLGIASQGLLTYDRRGTGESQREILGLSLEAEVADLAAVIEDAGVAQFDLFAFVALPAVACAARYPKQVRRLVLHRPFLAPVDYRSLVQITRTDWSVARHALATLLFPNGPTELQRIWSNSARDSVSAEVAAMYMEYEGSMDLRELAAQIQAPTLIIETQISKHVRASAAHGTTIPDVRTVRVDATNPSYSTPEDLARLICEFFGHSDRNEPKPSVRGESAASTAIILFADIADSTALTERLGDAAFREKARALDGALRQAITSSGGTAIEGKLLGDGVLATFGAARGAIACAQACHEAGSHAALPLHIGIHAGDVIREEGNVFGGAVNIASRVAGEAAAGETLVSGTVRDLARTSAGVSFEDRGERELKGVGEPVRVWAVR